MYRACQHLRFAWQHSDGHEAVVAQRIMRACGLSEVCITGKQLPMHEAAAQTGQCIMLDVRDLPASQALTVSMSSGRPTLTSAAITFHKCPS